MRVKGRVCRTNLPLDAYTRGSGIAQAHIIMETILSHVADNLGLEKYTVQEINLMDTGDHFASGDIIDYSIKRCWTAIKNEYDFERKKRDVESFNK